MDNNEPTPSVPPSPRKRLKSLIKHPPQRSRSLSERGEVRILTKQLRKLEAAEPTPENVKLMLRLSQRIGKLRASINKRKDGEPVKRPVGRPPYKHLLPPKPEPEVVVNESPIETVLEMEKQRRETPEPSIVHEHARRAEVKAEIKKQQDAVKNPPITAPQSDVQEAAGGITPSKQTGFSVVSPGLLDMFNAVHRSSDGNEHDGSVGMTNALLSVYDHAPEPQEPVGEGGYMSDGMGGIKRGSGI
ncbi:MAG: hypothetical protein WB817_19985 [Terriglobales bacterium]